MEVTCLAKVVNAFPWLVWSLADTLAKKTVNYRALHDDRQIRILRIVAHQLWLARTDCLEQRMQDDLFLRLFVIAGIGRKRDELQLWLPLLQFAKDARHRHNAAKNRLQVRLRIFFGSSCLLPKPLHGGFRTLRPVEIHAMQDLSRIRIRNPFQVEGKQARGDSLEHEGNKSA